METEKEIEYKSRMETEKEIEYKSTIMEMRNIIKNQERVIEDMMLEMIYSKEKTTNVMVKFLLKL